MKKAGFDSLQKKWWSYTLQNEPYPDTYFDFDLVE
jgi:D-alanyl-D-alanine dipeptidase